MEHDSASIADSIRAAIHSGELPPGAELQTIEASAAIHSVSRGTVDKAYKQLAAEGLILTHAGRPAVVANTSPLWIIEQNAYDRDEREQPDASTTFERQCRALGMHGRTTGQTGTLPAPAWAASALADRVGAELPAHWGRGYAAPSREDGSPNLVLERAVMGYYSFVPHWVVERVPAAGLPRDETWEGGLYSVVERGLSTDLGQRFVNITGRYSTEEESMLLGVKHPVPLMVETMIAVDVKGRAVIADRLLRLFGLVEWELALTIN